MNIVLQDLQTFNKDDINNALDFYELNTIDELAEFIYQLLNHQKGHTLSGKRKFDEDYEEIRHYFPDIVRTEYEDRVEYTRNGLFHRPRGLPAIEYTDGQQEWWVNGERYRPRNLPTIVAADGTRYWHDRNGDFYRPNGLPTEERPDGTLIWYDREGLFYRPNDLPTTELIGGTKIWQNREGELHRSEGPAVIYPDGQQEWWTNGVKIR